MAKGYLYDNGDELITREEALPDTSEASAGDVLSLDSSKKPVWSAPSGGVDTVRVTGTIVRANENREVRDVTPDKVVLDKNYLEIKTALDSGKYVYIIWEDSENDMVVIDTITLLSISDGKYCIGTTGLNYEADSDTGELSGNIT